MPVVYDSPIGPTPGTGAPMGAAKTSILGQVMAGAPIPSLTGGAAAPSGANAQTGNNYIYANSGGAGMWLFLSIAGLIGFVVWRKTKK